MSGWKQTQSQTLWDCWWPVPTLPFKSDVTSSKVFKLSEPRLTHLQKGDGNVTVSAVVIINGFTCVTWDGQTRERM